MTSLEQGETEDTPTESRRLFKCYSCHRPGHKVKNCIKFRKMNNKKLSERRLQDFFNRGEQLMDNSDGNKTESQLSAFPQLESFQREFE